MRPALVRLENALALAAMSGIVLIPLLELDFELETPDGTRLSEAFEALGFEEGVRREGDPLTVSG